MRWLLSILFLCIGLSANAQDWIVITSGDTINCKIWAVEDGQIVYQTPDETRPQILPSELIANYQIYKAKNYPDFHPDPLLDLKKEKITTGNRNKGFRVGGLAGYTHMLAPISKDTPSSLTKYAKSTKSGYHINVDITYFFGRYFGLGIDYSHVGLKGHSKNLGNWIYSYRYEHDIRIDYWGIRPMARFMSKNDAVIFLPGIGIGYVHYTTRVNTSAYSSSKQNLTAPSLGVEVFLNLDFRIARDLYGTLGIGAMAASVSSNNYYTDESGGSNNLTRLDVSFGLRYYIN